VKFLGFINVMHWLLLVAFIGGHLLIYLAWLRHLRVFERENANAAYHGVAFLTVVVVVAAAFARGAIGFAALTGLLALQFIYSMSFLELWSLAEGSYSLQILAKVSRQGLTSREELIAACMSIGEQKMRHRLDYLLGLKLVTNCADGRLRPSILGGMIVRPLRIVSRLTTAQGVN